MSGTKKAVRYHRGLKLGQENSILTSLPPARGDVRSLSLSASEKQVEAAAGQIGWQALWDRDFAFSCGQSLSQSGPVLGWEMQTPREEKNNMKSYS